MLKRIRALTEVELLDFLGCSHCPTCHSFVTIHCEETEPNLATSTATCKKCGHVISADRWVKTIPYETLGGHLYKSE